MKDVIIKNFTIGAKQPLAVMTGPCVIESEDHALYTAEALKKMLAPLASTSSTSRATTKRTAPPIIRSADPASKRACAF